MMIDETLLSLVRCPVDGQTLVVAPQELSAKLNQLIAAGRLRDQADGLVEEPFAYALATADLSRVYPVRDGIPTLIPSESIPVPKDVP